MAYPLDPNAVFLHHPPPMTLAALMENLQVSPGAALVALGGVAVYVASRAAADALAGGSPRRPGLRALGHCLPIAVVALLCFHPAVGRPDIDVAGRPHIAVGIVFSTSVACLSLVLGVVTYLAPLTRLPPSRRAWPFVLPAALLALVAGFNGRLTWLHAGMLMIMGVAVLNLWRGTPDEPQNSGTDAESEPSPREAPWARALQLALALALAGVGGWAITRGAARLEQTNRVLTGIVIAGTILGPLLTLPVLGSLSRLAERGHTDSAVSTLVAMVLINLCAVLPLVVVTHYVLGAWAEPAAAALDDAYATTAPSRAAPYPMVSWRIDTVVLVVLGFAIIPLAIARWTLGRAESLALIFGYAIYLALVAILSTKWG